MIVTPFSLRTYHYQLIIWLLFFCLKNFLAKLNNIIPIPLQDQKRELDTEVIKNDVGTF